ncbi:MAG: site-specific recombinase [Gammaproteobacteria bacterium]
MEDLLVRIAASDDADVSLLARLISDIRPDDSEDLDQAGNNLLALCYLLEQHPSLRASLRSYLLRIIAARKQSHLYADTGIFPGTEFMAEAKQRLAWKVLPPAINDGYLKDVFGLLFPRRDDWEWIGGLDDSAWIRLLQALHFDELTDTSILQKPVLEILEALTTLSHRMTGLGLENELTRIHPAIEQHGSPFLGLNEEIATYVREYHALLMGQRSERSDEKQALVLIAQCRDTLQNVRKHAANTGVSISLTQLLVRIRQMLARIERLLTLLESVGDTRHQAIVQLFKELVTADNRKYSLRDLFSTHTELLALLVTENAGHTGEHYVTTTRKEYFGMLRSGMGAGLIVGFMAMLKVLAGKLSLAPLAAAFVYSMNYSLGFMLVHVLHFTIATKQPAMTASRIAASISETQKGKEQSLDGLADLCVNVFRTQFIAIIGNVALSIPTAYAIAWVWLWSTGEHLASPDKVNLLVHELSPIESLAIFHAAIAGVCLFLSGLISGYYDNKCLYNRIPERLQQRPLLQRLLGQERLVRFSGYIGNNLGALAGNFYFGLMLGSMGTIGFILGLPLDIRHITFSSAYFSFALVGSDHQLPVQTILISLAGVAAIGMTNLIVSFSLALMVALKSRRVRYRQWWPLAVLITKRFLKQPRLFFWPAKESRNGDGQTVSQD